MKFITRYEAVGKKGRCFVKRVLYPLGVRNVVTTIEREVVLVNVTEMKSCLVSEMNRYRVWPLSPQGKSIGPRRSNHLSERTQSISGYRINLTDNYLLILVRHLVALGNRRKVIHLSQSHRNFFVFSYRVLKSPPYVGIS